jgi:hypothetical protein
VAVVGEHDRVAYRRQYNAGRGVAGGPELGVLSASGPTLGVDAATLTPTDGDLAPNTNAALACLIGPAVYQTAAAKWKGLYSGVTN